MGSRGELEESAFGVLIVIIDVALALVFTVNFPIVVVRETSEELRRILGNLWVPC